MTDLTIITHVYNGQEPLAEQVARWKAYPAELKRHIEFIVIDDHSDTPIALDAGDLNLRLFRVDDDIAWNMPGCRNLAAMMASSPWMLYFDVDQVISAVDLWRLVASLGRLDRTRLHVFRRVKDGEELEAHINSFLISKYGFYRAGAYDEDFVGHYGFEDVLFRHMWRKYVGSETLFNDIAFEQLGHRTTGLDRDQSRNQALIQHKVATGMVKPKSFVRFAWSEVEMTASASVDEAGNGVAGEPAETGADASAEAIAEQTAQA